MNGSETNPFSKLPQEAKTENNLPLDCVPQLQQFVERHTLPRMYFKRGHPMIHKAVGKLFIVAGLVSLMMIGLSLPLRAASQERSIAFQESEKDRRANVSRPSLITTGTVTNAMPGISQTMGASPLPTTSSTSAMSPTHTQTPTLTPTLTSTPTSGPKPSPTPTVTPTASPPPTVGITGFIEDKPLIVGGVLLALFLLLLLGLLIIIRALRGKGPTQPQPYPRPAAPTGPHLESTDASGAQRRLSLPTTNLTIGRAPESDLVITQDFPGWETVSGRHARLYQEERQGNHWIVEDLDSTNGVYVNGKRTGRNLLRDGWQLGIGGVSFIFRAGGERGEA